MPFVHIVNVHEFQVMGLTKVIESACFCCGEIFKLGKHCFPNLIVDIDHIKLAYQFQIIHRKTFAKLGGQICGKLLRNLFTIGCTIFSVLFFLYNSSFPKVPKIFAIPTERVKIKNAQALIRGQHPACNNTRWKIWVSCAILY